MQAHVKDFAEGMRMGMDLERNKFLTLLEAFLNERIGFKELRNITHRGYPFGTWGVDDEMNIVVIFKVDYVNCPGEPMYSVRAIRIFEDGHKEAKVVVDGWYSEVGVPCETPNLDTLIIERHIDTVKHFIDSYGESVREQGISDEEPLIAFFKGWHSWS